MSSPRKDADKPLMPRQAWQPLTPRGIAAFAGATFNRLVFVQLIVAAIVVAALIWFLRIAWFPVITEAVRSLPEAGIIRHGTLSFGDWPQRLAENARLAIIVDADALPIADHVADIAVTFERNRLTICSAVGCRALPYDSRYVIGFNRPEAEPAWDAWRGPILALVGLLTVIGLFLGWWSMAFLYTPLVKLIAFFSDRMVTWRGAWRLSAAALLPGALFMALAIVLYGFGAIDLFRFSLLYVLHLLFSLVFISTSPLFLPKVAGAIDQRNPFNTPSTDESPAKKKSFLLSQRKDRKPH